MINPQGDPSAKHVVVVSEIRKPLVVGEFAAANGRLALRAVIEQGVPVTQDAVSSYIPTGDFDRLPSKKDPLVNARLVLQSQPKTVIRTGVRRGVELEDAAELFRDRLRELLEEGDIPSGDIEVVQGLGHTSNVAEGLVADMPEEDRHMLRGAVLIG